MASHGMNAHVRDEHEMKAFGNAVLKKKHLLAGNVLSPREIAFIAGNASRSQCDAAIGRYYG
jgi:hypothetical protein